jgi:hypothetical protein
LSQARSIRHSSLSETEPLVEPLQVAQAQQGLMVAAAAAAALIETEMAA